MGQDDHCHIHDVMESRLKRIEDVVDKMSEDVGHIREDTAVVKEFAVELRNQDLPSRVSTLEAFKRPLMGLIAILTGAAAAITAFIKGG